MPCAVTLRGLLEPVVIQDDYASTLNSLNNLATQGKAFALTQTEDGPNVLLNITQILTILEIE